MSESHAPGPAVRFFITLALAGVLLTPTIAHAQAVIKVNDNVSFRLGALVQAWADDAQDAATKGYQKNLFLRRMRILISGQVTPNITFFFDTDNPNLGKNKTATSLGSGFITQDAFIEWKPKTSAFMLDAGLMLPPLCRNCVESAASLLSLDYGSYSFTESAPTQSSVGRDTGFQAKGYLAGGHFEYRAGLFQGFRRPASAGVAASSNSLRTTGRVQYNVWETETGYTYPGLYLANKKILSVGVGADHQSSYKAYSGDVFVSYPTVSKDAFNGELTLFRFDGGTFLPAIAKNNAATLQFGYYLAASKVMPWGRVERQSFSDSAKKSGDNNRLQVGLTWLPNGNNFNIKGAYSRVHPKVGNNTNEFTVQMQFFYY